MLAAFLLAAQTAAAPPASELRGLWVVRTALVSPSEVDRVVDAAAAGGLNALFVQVRGRGDAFYTSRLVEKSPLLARQPADFDPLQRVLERAHARGLQVHAWVNVLLAAPFTGPPTDHVVSRHPEWLMAPRAAARTSLPVDPRGLLWLIREKARADTDVEGYYLSPSSAGASEHLEAVVRELSRGYPIDGLHLDFIRYPGPDYDYSLAALEGFARRQATTDLLGAPGRQAEAWDAYRRQALSGLVATLAHAARQERSGLVVSAAVVPDQASARSHKFQDWPGWLAARILDAVCPMTYTDDSRIFRDQVAEARARAGRDQPVWAGVGAYRLSLSGIVEKIAEARAAGAAGYVLFSHEAFDAAALVALRTRLAARPPGAPALANPAGAVAR